MTITHADDVLIEGTLDVEGDITLDDGSGDSPKILFVGNTEGDTAELFLDDETGVGNSFLVLKLCDAEWADSRLEIRDSNGTPVANINSCGECTLAGRLFVDQSCYLRNPSSGNSRTLYFVNNQGTSTSKYIFAADGCIITNAYSFQWRDEGTERMFLRADGILQIAGDYTLDDGHYIGVGLVGADVRIVFDSTNDYIEMLGGNVGIGTASPSTLLTLYDSAANVELRLDTDKADGAAWIYYVNDATAWTAGIASGDDFQIRDAALCVLQLTASDNALTLPNLATEGLKIKDAGTAAATEHRWIAVEVGGTTSYIRTYASK